MKKVFCISWILCFLILIVAGTFVPQVRNSSHIWVYVIENDSGMEVLSKADYFGQRVRENRSTDAIAQAIYEPVIKQGPIKWAFEWSTTESIFHIPSTRLVQDKLMSQEKLDDVYQALIDYANADPNMTKYRPGLPPQTRFSWSLLGNTIVRLFIITAISTLVSFGVKFVCDMEQSIRRRGKRNRGLCAWCGYPCADLKSMRCPECGKHHTVSYSEADSEKPEDA